MRTKLLSGAFKRGFTILLYMSWHAPCHVIRNTDLSLNYMRITYL